MNIVVEEIAKVNQIMIELGFVKNVVLMIMSSKVGEWSVKFLIDCASAEMFLRTLYTMWSKC